MNNNLLLLLRSTAFGGFVSILIGFYQWRIKSKLDSEEKERKRLYNDIKYYHEKYREDEDEIDILKEEIRKLKSSSIDLSEKEDNTNNSS